MNRENLIGNKYGSLTVQSGEIAVRGQGKKGMVWLCLCDCGGITKTVAYNLKNGKVKTCGCWFRNHTGINSPSYKHGHRTNRKFTPEYKAWTGLKERCKSLTRDHADRYIGRGITYCEEWESFETFLKDMGKSPGKGYSIDRIENNQGYSKGNCKWSTKTEQAQNTARNVMITFRGAKKCLSEWARIAGVSFKILKTRYNKRTHIEYLTSKLEEV